MIFSIFRFVLGPQIPDVLIVVSQPNIVQTIHQWKYYLFSFQDDVYIYINLKKYPYDWFYAPGSHMYSLADTKLLVKITHCNISKDGPLLFWNSLI